MNVLSIGSDRALFTDQSQVRTRALAYARALGALHVIVFSLARDGYVQSANGPLTLYPTNSLTRLNYVDDAIRIARRISKCDLVTTQDPFESGIAGMRIAHAKKIPLHVQLHTDPFSPYFVRASLLNRIRVGMMPRVLHAATRIRVVADRLKVAIEERIRPPASVNVLPIFADTARFQSVVRTPEKGHLLWVGRFTKEKNPVAALDAFTHALALGKATRLTMLGEGPLRQKILEHARALRVPDRLMLPGWTDSAPFLATAELQMVTSLYEGYGLAIVEALAAHVPVVSTDVGIAREAGAHTTSLAHFSQTVAELLSLGVHEGRLNISTESSFEVYVQKYIADLRMTVHPQGGFAG